ncbi:tolloid-like protein 2 [Actinia tenebrosa]|uniref:Tolloid-like protein 2 n=1 Tax=Actinia tenebrosa TaxID=6105 RepID=A0A6P8I3K0_ACTTE|nr:tolloid-like protein 2 [Actinia tenebrosa]
MSILFFNILYFFLVCSLLEGAHSSIKTFNGISGRFSSEKESNGFYPNNFSMEYRIQVPSGRRAMLSFKNFSILGSMPNCSEDYVEISLGCQNIRSIGKYCSCGLITPLPFDFYSIDECMTLTFKSDVKYAAQGFVAEYSSDLKNQPVSNKDTCTAISNQHNSSVSNIFTPLWPNNYPTKTSCSWNFENPVNYSIIIQFMDFEIERTVFCDPNEEKDDRVMIKASRKFVSGPFEIVNKRICSLMNDVDKRKIFRVIVPDIYRKIAVNFINDADSHTATGFTAGMISYKSDPPDTQSCRVRLVPPRPPTPSMSPNMLLSSANLLLFATFYFAFCFTLKPCTCVFE